MSWGGGGWGGGGGGLGGGQAQGGAADGLGFAGIPPELQTGVDRYLEREGTVAVPEVTFHQNVDDRRPFTLRRFIAPHWVALSGAFLLVVIETVTLQAGPLLTKIGIDRGISEANKAALVVVALAYLFTVVVSGFATWARVAATGRIGERLMMALRIRIFSQFQRLSLDFFTEEKAGRLMTRMTSDVDALTQLFQEGLVQLVVQSLTLVIVTAVLFALDWRLALVVLVAVVPAMLVLTLWFRGASARAYSVVRERIADVLAHLQESLSGVRIVTAYNRQRHNTIEHRNIVGSYRDANDRTARIGAIYGPGTEMIGIAGQALLLAVGGTMVLNDQMSIGTLAAFVLYLTAFFAPIQQLVQLYNTYQQGQAAVAKIRDLLLHEPTVAEAPDADDLPPARGEIVFENVSFGYDPATLVLRDVDLAIPAGETFALVGATGAGKSTIAKLVLRFYDPTTGRVLIDGQDLRHLTFRSLRRQLGNVPQEAFLFGGSIRDNVAFARPDADDDEILEACRAVGIGDLVERLPQGLDTQVHERGVALSSGERQLLALARAFLARPRILVLDEATSNLDLRSEAKIEQALDLLLEGRTAILIAHRLATAMRADRIAVVDDGRIVELGSHDELVAMGGRYARMYATWEDQGGISTVGTPAVVTGSGT